MSRVIKAKYMKGVFTPHESVRLREDEVVGVIFPEPKEDEDDEVFLASAGGWKDLVPEEFIKELCERRLRGTAHRSSSSALPRGYGFPSGDLAIAATALYHDLVLFTENRKHYEQIPGLA